jgi:hypothetical protein
VIFFIEAVKKKLNGKKYQIKNWKTYIKWTLKITNLSLQTLNENPISGETGVFIKGRIA